MNWTDLTLITDRVAEMTAFYEAVFGVRAEGQPPHVVIPLEPLSLILYSRAAAQQDMGMKMDGAGSGRTVIGLTCDDLDAAYDRIRGLAGCDPTPPQRQPWGARSFRFRDPDGNWVFLRSWN